MRDIEEISNLYQKYGFRHEETGDYYIVFSLEESIYPGVDILVDGKHDVEGIRRKYADARYSTNVFEYIDSELLDLNLYKRFLRPKVSCENMLRKYDEYIAKVMAQYIEVGENERHPEYEYIKVGYLYECNFRKVYCGDKSIIDSIVDLIGQPGARLIIVEAAAGFGKTSTSQELVKYLCKSSENRRPFLMELERDRQATTFRYLLLSQIERYFEVQLKNDIVIDNIKKGRIPLIIDGFDELLSKDMDSGREIVSIKKVETMLSTIAELLEGNAKIVLTTRKTAIFSGVQFTEWYDYQNIKYGRFFTIDRFQLQESNVDDWIVGKKRDLLPDTLSRISNPVLLSYLKYSDVLEDEKKIDSKKLVEKYFNSMYVREKTRQFLQMTPKDQEVIMRNLSVCFCLFDITADTRINVKDAIYELNKELVDNMSCKSDELDELLNKLVNHALLDRHESGLVGFINDFVYGSLLGKAMTSDSMLLKDLEDITVGNVMKIIESNEFQSKEERKAIANTLYKIPKISTDAKFQIDFRLLGEITCLFDNIYCERTSFKDVIFCTTGEIKNATFVSCRFDSCLIDWDKLNGCKFIGCDFSNSEFRGATDSNDLYDCVNHPEDFVEMSEVEIETDEEDIDVAILTKFFRSGSDTSRIRHISGIIRDLETQFSRRKVMKHISRLKTRQFIYVDGDNAWIMQSGSDYVKNYNNNG